MGNKKGQMDFPIVTMCALIFALLIIGPMILKVMNEVKAPMEASLGNISETAAENFNTVMNTGINFWDKAMIFIFFLMLIIMIISSFMIDTHPFWVILYIIVAFLLVLFVPDVIGSLDKIYDSANFATEVNQLSFLNSLRLYFGEFLIGFIVLSGIIIYGKLKYFSGGAGGRAK